MNDDNAKKVSDVPSREEARTRPERFLATVLFTDIVGSTERAAELGDRAWRDLLGEHNARVRRDLDRFGGREISTAGDGFLAAFDDPEQAIHCASAIRAAVRELGLEIRGGLHSGEVQVMEGTVGGIAVHIGARVAARAQAGEVLISSTVRDLVAGSGLRFEDRGLHALKGVPGEWRLFAVAPPGAPPAPAEARPSIPEAHPGRFEEPAAPRGIPRRATSAAAALLLLLAFAAIWWIAQQRSRPSAPVSPTAVAVFPFTVRAGEQFGYLGDGMVDLLSTKLDGAGDLRSVDPRAILGMVAQEGERALDPERGRTVAARLGAGRYVLGSVVQLAERLHLDASLYDPQGGTRPVAQAAVEGDEAQIFDLVDELARQLLAGESRGPGGRVTRLAALTTHSVPALKAYLKGESAFRAGRFDAAVEAFQQAVAADSLFALADYRLSIAAQWSLSYLLARETAERAVRHADRLSRHDRLLLEGALLERQGAASEAEARYRAILATYPDDVEAWFQLGEMLFHYGPLRGRSITESREPFERVLFYEPQHAPSLVHLARIASVEGAYARLDSLAGRVLALQPEGDRILEMKSLQVFAHGDPAARKRLMHELEQAGDLTLPFVIWNVACFTGDLEGARDISRLLSAPSRSPEVRALGHVMAAHLELARGRWRAARSELTAAEPLNAAVALEYRALLSAVPFLAVPRGELEALRARLSAWDAASAPPSPIASGWLSSHDGLHEHLRIYLLGLLSARLGDRAAAVRHAGELERLAAPADAEALVHDLSLSLRAQAAWGAGRPPEALALLSEVRVEAWQQLLNASGFHSKTLERYVRAKLLALVGREEEALPWFGSFAHTFVYEVVYLAPSELERGAIYERLGQADQAAEHYSRFVELWKNCDPELRPMLEEGRRRLARLREQATADSSAPSAGGD